MDEYRSDAAIVSRLIERTRLLIALSEEIPTAVKLDAQPLLKMFEASIAAAAADPTREAVVAGYYARLCEDLDEYPDLSALLGALKVFLPYL